MVAASAQWWIAAVLRILVNQLTQEDNLNVYRQIDMLLGGFSIKIMDDSNIPCKQHHLVDVFSCPVKKKNVLCQAIELSLKELMQINFPASERNILYADCRVTLCRTETDSFRLLCLNESGNDTLWNLNFDSNFSQFEYGLSHEAIEQGDLIQLAFNRFLLQHTFINHHGLIIHAAGGSIHGKGMVFPAVSGTGKSTLSHLLLPHPENQLFSEERIIMRRTDDGWHLWGTPWKGTGVIARNESAPLNALVFLSQAPETKISKLPPSAALRRLLETVSIPWYSQEWTDKGLSVCESLLRDIPVFELAFRPDQTAVQAVADLAASLD
ncbi:MAG: hypothetical protein CDV28_1396 [Candidatus Electronema aureum]|uniref:SynChlorMet cassette protein ScmC n=1 Tax=Candidatus Electronema aureum TaxID=2005002 RepID=A0A521FZA7_9BACT|nr:MAG: hypothetical protein CDV28_1396 [Candidatus Electronema aureum]